MPVCPALSWGFPRHIPFNCTAFLLGSTCRGLLHAAEIINQIQYNRFSRPFRLIHGPQITIKVRLHRHSGLWKEIVVIGGAERSETACPTVQPAGAARGR